LPLLSNGLNAYFAVRSWTGAAVELIKKYRDYRNDKLPASDFWGARSCPTYQSHCASESCFYAGQSSIASRRSSVWRVAFTERIGCRRVRRRIPGSKDLRSLADKISEYGQGVHQRYPTGDEVVSVRDLAEQLGKRPDAVAKALHLLLTEQKVQEAPLKGCGKLNA
jgi:hypothetical protein